MAARESRPTLADAGARLYDADFYEWCIQNAKLLRDGRLEEVDVEHVTHEIEELGKSESRALETRTLVIMLHLLKIRYHGDKRSKLWQRAIVTQRVDITRLLRYSPSLKRFLSDLPERIYDGAVEFAMIETGLFRNSFPRRCPFTPDDVFGEELRETRSTVAQANHFYDADFYEWCIHTAKLLRAGCLEEVDLEHVAEEIEDLGKSQHHALDSRTTLIIMHLLKMRYQPERPTRSWDKTIRTQRVAIRGLLRNNPRLRRFLPNVARVVYEDAVELAAIETGLPRETFPSTCPFTMREIFGDDIIPAE